MGRACDAGTANIIELVMGTFPLLEAIGNAKNTRNNNSSRYGKWMEIFINSAAKIVGCTVHSFLLEKSRVTAQNKDERK